jgi:hypothetical protein
MKSYASLADLKRRLGISVTTFDDDLGLALVTATRLLDIYVGDDTITADDAWTGDATDVVVATDPPAAYVAATLYLAVRVHKTPEVPFGVAGMTDQGAIAYVRRIAPELDLILAGRQESWGVA